MKRRSSGRRPPPRGSARGPREVSGFPDAGRVTRLSVDLALFQLDTQLAAGDDLDTKAVALLGITGAGVAALIAGYGLFPKGCAVPIIVLGGLAIAAWLCSLSIFPFRYNQGPILDSFYLRSRGMSEVQANALLVGELRASHAHNRGVLEQKRRFFWTGLVALLATSSFALLAYLSTKSATQALVGLGVIAVTGAVALRYIRRHYRE